MTVFDVRGRAPQEQEPELTSVVHRLLHETDFDPRRDQKEVFVSDGGRSVYALIYRGDHDTVSLFRYQNGEWKNAAITWTG